MGHARALLGLTQRRQQIEVGALVAKKGLSVRDTEALVRSMLAKAAGGGGSAKEAKRLDPNVQRLQDELSEKLGAPVQIQHSRVRARARSSSAITRSMSSTAFSRTSAARSRAPRRSRGSSARNRCAPFSPARSRAGTRVRSVPRRHAPIMYQAGASGFPVSCVNHSARNCVEPPNTAIDERVDQSEAARRARAAADSR